MFWTRDWLFLAIIRHPVQKEIALSPALLKSIRNEGVTVENTKHLTDDEFFALSGYGLLPIIKSIDVLT